MTDKKKTLTVSANFKKKPDNFNKDKFSKPTRFKPQEKKNYIPGVNKFARKNIEQESRKKLITKNDNKTRFKSKLKLNTPLSKGRELKLSLNNADDIEEIEIKQRSLASLKRARLKEKKTGDNETEKKEFKKIVREVKIPERISIQELSNRMAEKSSDLIKFLMGMKVMATINHIIDKDTAEYLVKEFGHKPVLEKLIETDEIKKNYASENLEKRPPVVTIMGHVDHGKTSLLDALRNSNVVSGEHGGITQHIGAYQVQSSDKKLITFIDTPGHAAFTEMRARGAKITDIVVLVVAADDGVKPQTVEAIKHSKAAKVPIIVAINKCDLPNKNITKIKNELMQYELIAEDLSGDTIFVEVSAKNKLNLDKLLESIILQSEIMDLKSSKQGLGSGIVIESKIDKGKGAISTVLVTQGTIKKGEFFVCGSSYGKIRALVDHQGIQVNEALPSQPVEILGFNTVVNSGTNFEIIENEKQAKNIAEQRSDNLRNEKNILIKDKNSIFENVNHNIKELNLIIKSDVHGSSEALKNAIINFKHDEVKPTIILSEVGMINETDINLAKATQALVIGFNVKPNKEAKKLAEDQDIKILFYNIIYKVIEDLEKKLGGLLEPEIKEKVFGTAEILQVFKLSKSGKIAGSKVIDGEIKSNSKARILRDGAVIYNGEITSLYREKNSVKEVKNGLECGIALKDFIDFKEKDVIESYQVEKIARTL